jgi:hypothetical protein
MRAASLLLLPLATAATINISTRSFAIEVEGSSYAPPSGEVPADAPRAGFGSGGVAGVQRPALKRPC